MRLQTEIEKIDHVLTQMRDKVRTGPEIRECEVVREHMQAARQYLLGSMESEYLLNLRMAGDAANDIDDSRIRASTAELIEGLIRQRETAVKQG